MNMRRAKVVVVGGGSAGWIAASYLNAVLNERHPTAEVTLIEAPSIARIGVGEATVPSIRETLSRIGIREDEFLKESDGTFKSAIAFRNWRKGANHEYLHPFDQRAHLGRGDRTAAEWLTNPARGDWASQVSILSHLAKGGRAPKAIGWPDWGSTFPYAYHMDADAFASHLSIRAKARGVGHIEARVVETVMDSESTIASLKLDDGTEIAGDLFLDCSGFAALLTGRALNVPLVKYDEWLMCDRAVTMRVPYDVYRPERIRPYTVSTAMGAGWIWDIPLRSRRGIGYVYSSAFLSDEAAEYELRNYEGPHAKNLAIRRLEFPVGRRAENWVGNCVAVGLSSGFVEPLESTALYTVEAVISSLVEHLDFSDLDHSENVAVSRQAHNRRIANLYEEILDFVNLHYCTSDRSDTAFWREVTSPRRVSPGLASLLELWRVKAPSNLDLRRPSQLFSAASYEYILFGMLQTPSGEATATELSASMREAVRKSLAKMPSHEDLLSHLVG